jgi:fatty-acyl-CoA synthase
MGFFKRVGNEIVFVRAALRSLKKLKEIRADTSRTYSDIIEELARTKPNNIAIYFEDKTLTYRQYNE